MQMHRLRPRDEDVRGDLARQLRLEVADSILTCHPYTIVAGRELDLAPRLYPDVLEFKHQRRITLDLFADPAHDHGFRVPRRDHRHGHRMLPARRYSLHAGICRNAKLSKPGNYVPVRATDRVIEKLHEPALDGVGYHVRPPAGLDVDLFPGQPDDADQQALGQPVLAHHPHGQLPPGLAERQLAVALDVDQAVALHPGHRLAHGRAALRQALGNARTQRDDTFLFQLEDCTKVHLSGVDEPVRRQRFLPSPLERCYAARPPQRTGKIRYSREMPDA